MRGLCLDLSEQPFRMNGQSNFLPSKFQRGKPCNVSERRYEKSEFLSSLWKTVLTKKPFEQKNL